MFDFPTKITAIRNLKRESAIVSVAFLPSSAASDDPKANLHESHQSLEPFDFLAPMRVIRSGTPVIDDTPFQTTEG